MTLPQNLTVRVLSYLIIGCFGASTLFHTANKQASSFSLFPNNHNVDSNPIFNSTLGFQYIFSTLLPEREDRKQQLLKAANATGLDFTFLEGVHDSEVPERERPPDFPEMDRIGDYACAVVHIRQWKMIVEKQITTALITESDVDWDPRLRTQLSAFASASYNFTNYIPNTSLSPIPPSRIDRQTSPYGNDWDIIWFGNCGVSGQNWQAYTDDTAPRIDKEHELIHYKYGHAPVEGFERSINQRLVIDVRKGVCTQAYAISLRGAKRLSKVAAKSVDQMIDTWIGSKCGDGTLRCVAPFPQIFDDAKSTSNMDLSKDDQVGEPVEQGKAESVLQYSIRVNAEKVREGKGMEEWEWNWLKGKQAESGVSWE